jgi:ribosomal protein S18 acetylase RimI-like enzyme
VLNFKTLEKTDEWEIFEVLMRAFQDYFVTLSPDFEVHQKRWKNAGVDLSLSYGAFENEKLVGFVLIAPKFPHAFNLATGVVPEARGQKITKSLLEKVKNNLKNAGYQELTLEVIQENKRALRVYQESGFSIRRSLLSYKGILEIELPKIPEASYDLKNYSLKREHLELSHYKPSFEQSFDILSHRANEIELHELRMKDKLLAFALFVPATLSLLYLSGESEYVMAQLLKEMKLTGEKLGMTNVDEGNTRLRTLLENNGLAQYVAQYEMELFL